MFYGKKFNFLQERYQLEIKQAPFIHVKVNGFYTTLAFDDRVNYVTIRIGAWKSQEDEGLLQKLKEMKKEWGIKHIKIDPFMFSVDIAYSVFRKNLEKRVSSFFDQITAYLTQNGYSTGCFLTGNADAKFTKVNDRFLYLSDEAMEEMVASLEEHKENILEKDENILLGLIGATIGALIGAALWVVIGLLRYYAWFAGIVAITLAFWGYKWLGGKVSKLGAVLVFVISITALFAGSVVEWTWYFYDYLVQSYDITFFDVLPETLPMILGDSQLLGDFALDFGIGIAVVLIAGIPMLIKMYSEGAGNYEVKRFE